jgi:hypothetical protein
VPTEQWDLLDQAIGVLAEWAARIRCGRSIARGRRGARRPPGPGPSRFNCCTGGSRAAARASQPKGHLPGHRRCAPEDLARERGPVLEEWRMSRTSGGRMQEAHWKLILEGSKCVGPGGGG